MKWCNKALFKTPIRYGICLTAEDFAAILKTMKHESVPFMEKGDMGATHRLEVGRSIRMVVCLNTKLHKTDDKLWATVVHEAVHVWQAIREYLGETQPAVEQEAYCIEQIASNLIAQYRKRVNV
jgi:hypothetical protein